MEVFILIFVISIAYVGMTPTSTSLLGMNPVSSADLWPVLFAPLAVILLVLLIVVVGVVVYIKHRRNLLTKESEDKRIEGVSEGWFISYYNLQCDNVTCQFK